MRATQRLLVEAIEEGFSERLQPEILNRMGDVFSECGLQRLSFE
jgi:hypothetical protein